MKKTYIAPSLVMVKIAPISVIAFSDPQVGLDDSGEVEADKVETKSYISDGNVWDNLW
ncbi:MAG: hypothetical protein K6F47_01935 [Bacteroidaceae bacterium]|nr:hypothetical protein [Bacteroidaceae bacterium]